MKKIELTTPENIDVEYTLADLGSRVAAAVIDLAIQGFLLILLAIAIVLIVIYAPDFWDEYLAWIIAISILINAVISYAYYIFMELNMNGRTPGKKILKLRTIRNNGQPLTLKHSAIRNLFRVFLDMLGVGVVSIFFTKEHKRIGDFAASTIVVVEKDIPYPITLENLPEDSLFNSLHLSEEDNKLLQDYFVRKNTIINSSILKNKLEYYLTNKYENPDVLKNLGDIFSS
ncbi:RDD family protein [Halocella sp. SP3-1]|uniref:RDD family protein n=1 Tax=Halocella sp. SP3-1 TaxID=2382161 RepID=UPI000F7573E1|nr:RDD family protein [Halocella sp. SP3-1]AZO95436.1 RDD family protein [Halocella sp. SP3-1]